MLIIMLLVLKIFIYISGYVSFTPSVNASTSYAVWLNRNGNDNDRYGYSETSNDNDQVSMNFSTTIQLASGDTITLMCWSNAPNYYLSEFTGRILINQMAYVSGSENPFSQTETLAQVLTNGNVANQQDITDLANLTMTKYLTLDNSLPNSYDAQLHFNGNDGSSWQMNNNGGIFQLQYYPSSTAQTTWFNALSVNKNQQFIFGDGSQTSTLYVNGSSGASRVFDTIYNVPQINIGSIAYFNLTSNSTITVLEPQGVPFFNLDSANSINTSVLSSLQASIGGVFKNIGSFPMMLNVSGYVSIIGYGSNITINKIYALWGQKNTLTSPSPDIYGLKSFTPDQYQGATDFNFNIVLQPNDTFVINYYTSTVNTSFSNCRIIISRLY